MENLSTSNEKEKNSSHVRNICVLAHVDHGLFILNN